MKRHYFFFDIDGTLTSTKVFNYVPESTLKALKALEANGHFVAIATGRAHFRAKEFVEKYHISNMVCEGGNGLYLNNELISYTPLDNQVILQIAKEADAKGFPVAISLEDSRVRVTKDNQFIQKCPNSKEFMELKIVPDLDLNQLHDVRRIMIAMKKEEEHLLPSMNQIGIMRYDDSFVIVEPDDKYKGIETLIKHIHGNLDDIVVFGDGLNDRKMFKKAPFKIAMGNAIPELKELADYVTTSSDDDGIWNACKHFGWI